MPSPDYSISTPENVDLHLELAGLGNRILACLIDKIVTVLILLGVLAALWFIFIMLSLSPISSAAKNVVTAVLIGLGILLVFILIFGYFIFFEATWQGQTPGKKIVQIRVIDQSGQPVSGSAVFIRNILRVFDEGVILIGLLSMIIDRHERRFGDLAAGTLVIRERLPELSTADIVLKYPLDKEDVLDVGRITPEEYDLLVSFLKRRNLMASSQRPAIAHQVSEHFRQRLDLTKTAEAEPERFLEQIYSAYKSRAAS